MSEHSPETAELDAALALAQKAFPPIERSKTVSVKTEKGSYSFDYAPLDEIIDAVRPALAANGLSVKALIATDATNVTVTTKLSHSSGQFEQCSCVWPRPSRIQEFGGVVSYLRRYALCGILNIAAETDDDGNASDGNHREVGNKPSAKPAQTKPAKSNDAAVTTLSKQIDEETRHRALAILTSAAGDGIEALELAWKSISPAMQKACKGDLDGLKAVAFEADARTVEGAIP